MLKTFMLSKIHRATVTAADLNYVGSITIAPELLKASGIAENEQVQVVNINNGARFFTYVIKGAPNSGDIIINGAAARLTTAGDIVIIIQYGILTEIEAKTHKPKVIHVNEKNQII